MLRLIHNQTVQGPLVIKDIDDGIPNKTAKRGTGDPKKYHRDGSTPGGKDLSTEPGVNYPKQSCYVPRTKIGNPAVAGYIDLVESDRVLMSQSKGDIKGFADASKITVVSYATTDLATPVVTTVELNRPTTGDLTITGTGLTSLTPNTSTVVITGTGATTLTQAAIVTAGGSVGATAIVIPAALVTGVVVTASSAKVLADDNYSNIVAVTVWSLMTPVIIEALLSNPTTGDLTITGSGFVSTGPETSSVVLTGTGAVTLASADIVSGSGTFTDTSIVIPAALVTGIVETATSAKVVADTKDSDVVALTTWNLATPVLTAATLDSPTAGDLTLTGSSFLSTLPNVTSVVITGTAAVTLTSVQILEGLGTMDETSIVIPAALIPGVATSTSSVKVVADTKDSAVVALT